jgi:AhpD family alkylhydroperoxidase
MTETFYPRAGRSTQGTRPGVHEAFEDFSHAVFADGALPERTKELIAVAVAHVTQCPYCITGHTRRARRKGASPEEIMEAIWVAAEMRAVDAYAHATLALRAMGAGSSDDNALSEASTSHLPATWRRP